MNGERTEKPTLDKVLDLMLDFDGTKEQLSHEIRRIVEADSHKIEDIDGSLEGAVFRPADNLYE